MAGNGHEPYDDTSLKGVSRYFNSKTIRGRANVRSNEIYFAKHLYLDFHF